MSSSLVERYSGVVLNQNQPPREGDDAYVVSTKVYQEFLLPHNFIRGTESTEGVIPSLSGIQILARVDEAMVDTAKVMWTIEHQVFGLGWLELANGTTTGVHTYGDKVWMDLLFEEPVNVSQDMASERFRFSISVTSIEGVWYSAPNPLALSFSAARQANGTTAITSGGDEVSFCFRILGLVGDEGTDFLGNTYRSAVVSSSVDNVSTVSGDEDASWMSDPCPSRFGVKSLYFDVRPDPSDEADDNQKVIDRVLIDPMTPNVWFTVYYSNEGDPETDESGWANKLWTRVPATFKATKREAHVLPEPITTKYIKIEFTHLQAKSYDPGDFARPVKYQKHPKWVLDYFLTRVGDEDRLISGRVAVIYDALDLAYNYYLDDLKQEPQAPVQGQEATNVVSFLRDRSDFSDQIDPVMLDKINFALQPYQERIQSWAKSDYLLGLYSRSITEGDVQPSERANVKASPELGELRHAEVVFENDYPVMFFFLTCRHKYREVVAPFSHNRAYFVGIREIAFTRENYTTAYDNTQYIEPAGDLLNVERNDLVAHDGVLSTH